MAFTPKLILGAFGEYSGNVQLAQLPGISATEAANLSDAQTLQHATLEIGTNPNIITGAGTYGLSNTFFAMEVDGVTLSFFAPDVKHLAGSSTGEPVAFGSTGGNITFISYGKEIGDRLSGSFDISIQGTQTIDRVLNTETGEEEDVDKVLTGRIYGSFNVAIED